MADSGSVKDAAERFKKATEKLLDITNVLKAIKVEFMKQTESLIAKVREIEGGEDAAILAKDALEKSEKEFDRFAEDMEREASRLKTIAEELENLTSKEPEAMEMRGPPVIIRCKRWDDFKASALQA